MIDNVNMQTNLERLRYIKKAQIYDAIIALEIEERKNSPKIIGEYAHIICDPKNPYNQDFLKRFPKP